MKTKAVYAFIIFFIILTLACGFPVGTASDSGPNEPADVIQEPDPEPEDIQPQADPEAPSVEQPQSAGSREVSPGVFEILSVPAENGYIGPNSHGAELVIGEYNGQNVIGLIAFDISVIPANAVIDKAYTQFAGFEDIGEDAFETGLLVMHWCNYGAIGDPSPAALETLSRTVDSALISIRGRENLEIKTSSDMLLIALRDARAAGNTRLQTCSFFSHFLGEEIKGYITLNDWTQMKLIVEYHLP